MAPEVAPRTHSAPGALQSLGRCSPEDEREKNSALRPASAQDIVADKHKHQLAPARAGGGMDATAVASMRPFEKHGRGGTTPSGVIPEGSDTVSCDDTPRVHPTTPPLTPHACNSRYDMSTCCPVLLFLGSKRRCEESAFVVALDVGFGTTHPRERRHSGAGDGGGGEGGWGASFSPWSLGGGVTRVFIFWFCARTPSSKKKKKKNPGSADCLTRVTRR